MKASEQPIPCKIKYGCKLDPERSPWLWQLLKWSFMEQREIATTYRCVTVDRAFIDSNSVANVKKKTPLRRIVFLLRLIRVKKIKETLSCYLWSILRWWGPRAAARQLSVKWQLPIEVRLFDFHQRWIIIAWKGNTQKCRTSGERRRILQRLCWRLCGNNRKTMPVVFLYTFFSMAMKMGRGLTSLCSAWINRQHQLSERRDAGRNQKHFFSFQNVTLLSLSPGMEGKTKMLSTGVGFGLTGPE